MSRTRVCLEEITKEKNLVFTVSGQVWGNVLAAPRPPRLHSGINRNSSSRPLIDTPPESRRLLKQVSGRKACIRRHTTESTHVGKLAQWGVTVGVGRRLSSSPTRVKIPVRAASRDGLSFLLP